MLRRKNVSKPVGPNGASGASVTITVPKKAEKDTEISFIELMEKLKLMRNFAIITVSHYRVYLKAYPDFQLVSKKNFSGGS